MSACSYGGSADGGAPNKPPPPSLAGAAAAARARRKVRSVTTAASIGRALSPPRAGSPLSATPSTRQEIAGSGSRDAYGAREAYQGPRYGADVEAEAQGQYGMAARGAGGRASPGRALPPMLGGGGQVARRRP